MIVVRMRRIPGDELGGDSGLGVTVMLWKEDGVIIKVMTFMKDWIDRTRDNFGIFMYR